MIDTKVYAARYFDGKSAKAHDVQVTLSNATGDVMLSVLQNNAELFRRSTTQLQISDPFKGTATRVELGENAVLEITQGEAFWQSLDALGHKKTFVQRTQTSWNWALGSVVGIILVGFLVFRDGIPWASVYVANSLPPSVDTFIGEQAWPTIEKQFLKPSKLTAERQAQLREGFAKITTNIKDAPIYDLQFRSSTVGPNAFAIPGGKIVMTDELIALSKDDNAIYGVLLHELGHVKYRHSLRNIVQTTAATTLISVWLGDVSSLVALIPGTLTTMKYSRDLENESDLYAFKAMVDNNIPTKPLAELFVKMSAGTEMNSTIEGLISSHPVTKERIKLFEGGKP
jgi:Zn-dependent protease with chaperone function